jgi:hypothetical protein
MRERWFLLIAALALFVGCGGGGGGGPTQRPQIGRILPDFVLPDVNPNSATDGMDVSPSDFRGTISVFYFAHAT